MLWLLIWHALAWYGIMCPPPAPPAVRFPCGWSSPALPCGIHTAAPALAAGRSMWECVCGWSITARWHSLRCAMQVWDMHRNEQGQGHSFRLSFVCVCMGAWVCITCNTRKCVHVHTRMRVCVLWVGVRTCDNVFVCEWAYTCEWACIYT